MKNKEIMATRKAYILTIGFLLLLALASCSPRHIVVPDHPNLSDKKGNFSETVLYVTLFNMKNQTKKDTEYYYTDSKNKFIEYLKAQNNFKDIHDATSKFTPPQNINYVTLEVQLTPHHTEHRTWILDIPFFFPFTGFWPVTPLWGKVSVDATAVINNTNGNPISKFDAQKEKEYKITFYSWYNKGPLEKALQECYEQSYTAISEEIREQSGAITRALEEDCWISAESTNNITAFESFLEGFPKAKHAAQAQAQLESLYFQRAEEVNTITAFEAFLKKYPEGDQADIAREKLPSLHLQKAKSMNSLEGYENFLKMYQEGELANEAQECLQNLKTQIKAEELAAKKKKDSQKKAAKTPRTDMSDKSPLPWSSNQKLMKGAGKSISVNNGFIDTSVMEVYTGEFPSGKSKIYLTVMLKLDGRDADEWVAHNAKLILDNKEYRTHRYGFKIEEGSLVGWTFSFPVPQTSKFELVSLQFPDGQAIDLLPYLEMRHQR